MNGPPNLVVHLVLGDSESTNLSLASCCVWSLSKLLTTTYACTHTNVARSKLMQQDYPNRNGRPCTHALPDQTPRRADLCGQPETPVPISADRRTKEAFVHTNWHVPACPGRVRIGTYSTSPECVALMVIETSHIQSSDLRSEARRQNGRNRFALLTKTSPKQSSNWKYANAVRPCAGRRERVGLFAL